MVKLSFLKLSILVRYCSKSLTVYSWMQCSWLHDHSEVLAAHFQDNLDTHDARRVTMPACYDGQGLMVQTASDGITAISPRSTGQTVTSKVKNSHCTVDDNTRSICTRMGYLKEWKTKKWRNTERSMKRTNQRKDRNKREGNMGRNKWSNKWRKEGKKGISVSLLRRMNHDHLSLLLVYTSAHS